MADHQMQIPEEYKSYIRYVDAKDKRSDAEIMDTLTTHVPITSEKNIWTYWHSGIQNMPSWCRRNVINWVRLHGSEWTVRVLDTVPNSPNHALAWIADEELPEAFVKGTMTGPYVGPHSADFLRGAALYSYGGVWMDVGNILFRHMDNICWDQLANDESPYTVAAPCMFAQHTANHFVAARKGDMFIKNWHAVFVELWKGRNDYTGVVQSPLIAFVANLDFEEAAEHGWKYDFKIDSLTLLGYLGQVLAWIRLTWLQEPNNGFNGVEHWSKKVLLWNALPENFGAEKTIGFKGEDLFNVFTTRRDADPNSEEYQRAEKATWRMLTQSTLQKITRGKNLTHSVACGEFLDLPENEGKDALPGTFGELLQYGSIHFEQIRDIAYIDPQVVAPEHILHKGPLEM